MASINLEELNAKPELGKDEKVVRMVTDSIGKVLTEKDQFEGMDDRIKGIVGQVKSFTGDNQLLNQTLEIAKTIFHIGETIPFVAPIFGVLK
eukprot:jgi/Hompol1/3096/HPOL_006332-RA